MRELADGWEIVSRRTDNPIFSLFMMLQVLLGVPEMPTYRSAVTFTVRQTATGQTRKVTARSEQEAKNKIELGLFDEADAAL
jgi:hypothetical protein